MKTHSSNNHDDGGGGYDDDDDNDNDDDDDYLHLHHPAKPGFLWPPHEQEDG